jgi:hypothetical protein
MGRDGVSDTGMQVTHLVGQFGGPKFIKMN